MGEIELFRKALYEMENVRVFKADALNAHHAGLALEVLVVRIRLRLYERTNEPTNERTKQRTNEARFSFTLRRKKRITFNE